MPEQIGNINVPTLTPSTTFPLISDFPHGIQLLPKVAIHQFLSGSVKIEQRFLLGSGPRRWRVLFNRSLTDADVVTLHDFWEDRSGAYDVFTYNAPSDDGLTTTAYVVRFEDEPLTFERFANMLSTSGVTLVEIPADAAAPVYTVAETLERFPDTTLETALTAQVQKLVPLISITTKTSGYPVIHLSDRRCTVGGQLYQPRLITWANITQRLGGQSDNAQFIFGNADKVMRDLAADVDLFKARLRFSLYDITTGILVNLWSGDVVNFKSTSASEFGIEAVDGLWSLNLQYPPDRIRPTCWKKYNDGINCPFSTEGALDLVNFPSADAGFCDRGYLTANGCKAHGMKLRFGGVLVTPQSVRSKDNSQGFMGFGRPTQTATSIVSDSIVGQPLTEIYTDIPMPVKCLIAAGRDEGDFYEGLGIVGAGEITEFDTGSFNAEGMQRLATLDGQVQHTFPNGIGRFVGGSDPAGATDYLSLDQVGSDTGGDPDQAVSGSSIFLDHFSAGVAFAVLRIKDEKGFQLTTLDQHSMEVYVSQGLKGWVWTSAGVRSKVVLTNPVWLAVNVYLRGIGLRNANAAAAEATFDVDAAIAAADICDITVDKIIGSGTETQFKFQGMLRDIKPLKDWIGEILNNCLGIYWFRNGKLTIGIREDAAAAHSFAGGNMIYQSLQLTPIRPAFNRIDVNFANADYEFVADSLPINDLDRIEYDGQPTDSMLNLAGAAGKSMAGRIGATRLKEEQGGVGFSEWKKAREATWQTTVLALGVEPGTGISIDDADVPGGTGLFRITGWTLNPDYSIDLNGITITDTMYDLVAGPKASDVPANGTPGQLFPAPLRPVWFANREAPQSGDPIYEVFDRTFRLRTEYSQLPTGQRVEMVLLGDEAVTLPVTSVPPKIRAHSSAATGGTLKADHSYYFSIVSTYNNYPSPNSNVVALHIPPGPDTATVTLSNLKWPAGTWDGWILFGGIDDNRRMCAQTTGTGALPTSITWTGPYLPATWNPPSPVYRFIRVKVKMMLHPGVIPNFITDIPSGGMTIQCSHLAGNPPIDPNPGADPSMLATDNWMGRILTVLPQSVNGLSGLRADGYMPILNFNITAYDADSGTFTLDRDPTAWGVIVGDVFIVRFKATLSTDGRTFTDSKMINGQYPFGNPLGRAQNIIRIYAGPGRGQWRTIVGNDAISYTVDRAWDAEDLPDDTSIWGVEYQPWIYFSETTPQKTDHFFVLAQLRLDVPNLVGRGAIALATMVDRNGNEAPEELCEVREFFLFGDLDLSARLPFPYATDDADTPRGTYLPALLRRPNFGIHQKLLSDLNGRVTPQIVTNGLGVVNEFSDATTKPDITLSTAPTGGSIRGGRRVIVMAWAEGTDGGFTIGKIESIYVPNGTNTNIVNVHVIFANPSADAGWVAITTDVEKGWYGPVVQAIAPGAADYTFTEIGPLNTPVPDELFDHFVVQARVAFLLGIGGEKITATHVGSTLEIVFPGSIWATDQLVGRTVSCYFKQDPTLRVPIVELPILSNTSDTVVVEDSILGLFDDLDGFLITTKADTYSATMIGDSALDTNSAVLSAGLMTNRYKGKLILIIAGTGAGTPPRIISANTSSIFTVTKPFAVTPDSTSQFIVIDSAIDYEIDSASFSLNVAEALDNIEMAVSIANNWNHYFIQIRTATASNKHSLMEASPFRFLFSPGFGDGGSLGTPFETFQFGIGTDQQPSDLILGGSTPYAIERRGDAVRLDTWDAIAFEEPTGDDAWFDILRSNDTTAEATMLLSPIFIPAGSLLINSGQTFDPANNTVYDGDRLRGVITKIGSTTPGKGVTINVYPARSTANAGILGQ